MGKRQRQKEKKERGSDEKKRWETRSPPKVREESTGTVEKTERVGERGGEAVVEETETGGGGKGGIQFNFLRNSLVFEIQPPKGCARG